MSIMDKMVDMTVGRMSKEYKEEMMNKVMDKFLADMTKDDKMKMIEEMAPKMMHGVNMKGMMPKMMMNRMMGGSSGNSCKMGMGMMGGKGPGMGMMPPMMKNMVGGSSCKGGGMGMMSRGPSMALSKVPKEKRADMAVEMINSLLEQAIDGMSKEEKKEFINKVLNV